ncbi:MAG: hypothetical protein V4819_07495 [Verrucomicrobiota bacterium]
MIPESNLPPEESPREILEANPADWGTRLQSASLLYDQGVLHEASALIWEANQIPCIAQDLALAACILAKDQPGKAIRLLTAVLETNRGKAAQNMGMANALLHHGMVLQAARFYGAALEINPKLVNLEFEHFFIWADDEQLLWENFKGRRSRLHEQPWMTRDSMEALELTRDVSRHTTPIAVPKVDQVKVEPSTTEALREKLTENPGDWDTRRTLAQSLHDDGAYGEAAILIWEADPIPGTDLDTAFAARVLAKDEPREAILLLTAVFERNRGKALQNMEVANALLHHGMVLESARFYGAAIDADPNLVNPDLEHFLLWTDDAKSLWGNFLKIRSPLGLFPWAHSDPTLDFGAPFSTPPILLSELKQVQGENLTNSLYQQLARKNARITPPPSVTFPADRVAPNDRRLDFNSGGASGQEEIAGLESEEEAKVEAAAKTRADEESTTLALAKQQTEQGERATAAAKQLAEEQAAAEAKAASLFAEAAESARTLIERAREEATTEVAAIRAKAQEELQAALEQARQNTEQEMAAIRAKAREEAEAAADAARKEAEVQAALIRAKAEEAAAQAEAAAKLRADEEERSAATAKQLAVEQANAAAEQAAAAQVAAEKARQEAISEVAALRAKAQEELEQARHNSEQEMAAIRAKAKEEAENEAALIRTKAEEDALAAEKDRLEATAQAEAAAKLRADENDRALALAKQRAEVEDRAAAAAKQLAEEQARAAAEKIHQEAIAEVSALRAQAQDELKAASEQARRNTEQEAAAIRAQAEEDAKKAAAAAEQARLEAAAQAKAAAEILARAEEEAKALALVKQRTEEEEHALAERKRFAEEQAQAAAQQARQEALDELAAIKAQAQEELKTATEQARLNSEQELKMLRAKAREESKALMENAAKEAAPEVAPIPPKSEEDAKLGSSMAECAPPAAVANAAAVIKARAEQERAIPVAGPIAKEQPNAVEKARIRQQGTNTKRRFGVLLVSAAAAMGVWQWIPGTVVDHTAFATVASGSSNGALFISGQGSREKPWTLRSLSTDKKADKRQAPLVVSLGDDLKGFFQSSPPAPIDLAVIFSNFHRLGAKKAATSAVFAWEKPDPIGLAAFEKSLDRFDSLVMAAPLSRGVVAAPMPPAFRRTSLPESKIRGEVSALPLVNRLPIQGIILSGGRTLAGFSSLESEPPSRFIPLMARWEDRVVFSFPLLTVLQRLDLPLDGMEVRLGEFLKLGPAGPIVPIDEAGRLALPLKPLSPYAEISAEALIDGGDDLFPKQAPDPVILRDDQTAAEPATREFSRDLSPVIAAIASNQGLSEAHEFPRLSQDWELGLLAAVVVVLILLGGASDFVRNMGALVLAGVCVAAQWIAFGVGSVWLPGLPMLAAIVCGMLVAKLVAGKSPQRVPASVSGPPPSAPQIISEPVEIAAARETQP